MSEQQKTINVTFDPLTELMAHYAAQKPDSLKKKAVAGPIEERLKHRIIDGEKPGLQADLDEALKKYEALQIINEILLDGMKVVGELFGSGQMQLPFVLQSAEVMKGAVAYLERFMDKASTTSRGVLVLATVKGDVHDIGKNLVDIILTNNGYRVVNLGIKCPIETMLHAADEHHADAIGMSGLLVKSTLIMKENLGVMNERDITMPVMLGGAALTRRYVEEDLRSVYKGRVLYANDAFDGLKYMGQIVAGELPPPAVHIDASVDEDTLTGAEAKISMAERSTDIGNRPPSALQAIGRGRGSPVTGHRPARQSEREGGSPFSRLPSPVSIPVPPFWGTKAVEEISLDEVFAYVNEVALIRGQWQVRKGRMNEEEYRKLLEEKIRPEYEVLRSKVKSQQLLDPAVVYGYFPCQSNGNDLIIYNEDQKTERTRFTFPRQVSDRSLCLADFFAPVDSGRMDVVAFHLVTMGRVASEYSARLFAANEYKDYLYFHGLSVESAEALAELWHKRIRAELGIAGSDAKEIKRLFAQGYQGSRYSFGYPACPNLEDQVKLMDLLDGGRIGVKLTEEFQMVPEQSTSAIIVHHPQAKYFNVK